MKFGDTFRFWAPIGLLFLFAAYVSQKLCRSHFDDSVVAPAYTETTKQLARRGAIYDATGRSCPLVKSVPFWEYHLDPVSLTNRVVRGLKGQKKPRTKEAICLEIARALKLDYKTVLAMSENTSKRYQPLATSADKDAHEKLVNRRLVAGVAAEPKQVREYLHGRRLSHILGSVNREGVGSSGLEQKYNHILSGVDGTRTIYIDARGRDSSGKEIVEDVPAIDGADIHLTIDNNLQYEVESALKWGVNEYGAGSGWCIVLDTKTAAVLALASLPDFHPSAFGRASDFSKVNRATSYTYEPGSVMKVITAASSLDAGIITPDTLYRTNRDDDRYYRLPGDGRHVWEPTMTVRDAIVHSSNIVIGKLGCDLGPEHLWSYMRAFGFGAKTGLEIPGEEGGILPFWRKWDKVKWSRAPIGQGVAVTAIQIAGAYQAIANDGVRCAPHLVAKIVPKDGSDERVTRVREVARPIGKDASRRIREMMLGVATKDGTARRAAIKGYSVAGKTGTAQKVVDGKYSDRLYRATFCGIIPSGVVFRNENDAEPAPPRVVILVSLDFDAWTKYHQGGNSAAPVFKRIAVAAMRYLEVEPDRPDELMDDEDDDYLDRIMEERERSISEEEDFDTTA